MRKDERISFGLTMYLLELFGTNLYLYAKSRSYFTSPSYNLKTMKDQTVFTKCVPLSTNMMLISNGFESKANKLGRQYLHVVKYWDNKTFTQENRRPCGFPFETFYY